MPVWREESVCHDDFPMDQIIIMFYIYFYPKNKASSNACSKIEASSIQDAMILRLRKYLHCFSVLPLPFVCLHALLACNACIVCIVCIVWVVFYEQWCNDFFWGRRGSAWAQAKRGARGHELIGDRAGKGKEGSVIVRVKSPVQREGSTGGSPSALSSTSWFQPKTSPSRWHSNDGWWSWKMQKLGRWTPPRPRFCGRSKGL